MNAPALTALAEFLSVMESVEGKGSAQMQTTHPAGCWGGRKSHGTHILLWVRAKVAGGVHRSAGEAVSPQGTHLSAGEGD